MQITTKLASLVLLGISTTVSAHRAHIKRFDSNQREQSWQERWFKVDGKTITVYSSLRNLTRNRSPKVFTATQCQAKPDLNAREELGHTILSCTNVVGKGHWTESAGFGARVMLPDQTSEIWMFGVHDTQVQLAGFTPERFHTSNSRNDIVSMIQTALKKGGGRGPVQMLPETQTKQRQPATAQGAAPKKISHMTMCNKCNMQSLKNKDGACIGCLSAERRHSTPDRSMISAPETRDRDDEGWLSGHYVKLTLQSNDIKRGDKGVLLKYIPSVKRWTVKFGGRNFPNVDGGVSKEKTVTLLKISLENIDFESHDSTPAPPGYRAGIARRLLANRQYCDSPVLTRLLENIQSSM